MEETGNKHQFGKTREQMIKLDLIGRGISSKEVLNVISRTPREEFVPEKYQSQAYDDGPLPIGMGQTISQPYIVALMTEKLSLNKNCQVLEVGTGSGYQTAILSKLAKKVYTIERLEQLSAAAQAALGRLQISNVEFYIGDGSCGWPEPHIFDRIIITAAIPQMPAPLIEQLAEGGLIMGPVGDTGVQELVVCEKKENKITEKTICGCRFVKLIGEHGF